MKRPSSLVLIAAGLLFASRGESQNAQPPVVQIVKYDALKEIVLKQRGKVVLVDVWFTL